MKRLRCALASLVLFGCVADANSPGDQKTTGNGGSSGTPNGVGGSQAGPGSGGGVAGNAAGDPNHDGPFAVAELDGESSVPATTNTVALHAAYPSDASGPFPVILFGHGFQLPPSQYYGYLRRLASFGYVAITVDFQADFFGVDHVGNAEELLHGLAWANAHATLSPIADVEIVGATGHSLGGKVALLAAVMDNRIAASITVDPVDGGQSCSPDQCPDVSAMFPLAIPTAFIGETTDARGGFMSCAPAADNFATFYAGATAPTISVDVIGANHMSFLDDVASCGVSCSFCNPATLDNVVVNDLARAFVVAFYQRHLKGKTDYDTYLTGNEAQARYVEPGLASIASK